MTIVVIVFLFLIGLYIIYRLSRRSLRENTEVILQGQRDAEGRAEFNRLVQSTAAAYAAYVKRTSQPKDLSSMAESEIHFFLEKNIREFNNIYAGINNQISSFATNGGWIGFIIFTSLYWILYYIGVIDIWNMGIFGMLFAAGATLIGYVIGGVVGDNTRQEAIRQLEERYQKQGLDVNRLKL